MAFSLPLPDALRKARWKVKIRDKETCEPPHVTILRGTSAWRINLRTGAFMESEPDPSRLPTELVTYVRGEKIWQLLCDEWDRIYPTNPVSGGRDEE